MAHVRLSKRQYRIIAHLKAHPGASRIDVFRALADDQRDAGPWYSTLNRMESRGLIKDLLHFRTNRSLLCLPGDERRAVELNS